MSKTIKMLAKITGTRNGIDWPEIGETYELPDDEADQLVSQKLAKYAPKTSATLKAADHIDHFEIQAANEAARASKAEVADADDEDTESTALTTRKAGRR